MITAIVLTKNEEQAIQHCLENLKWCQKVLVIDDESTDKTVQLARKSGAWVVTHAMHGDFDGQRNWALKQADTPWALFVDADEVVTDELAQEIQRSVQTKKECKGFLIPRHDYMWGKRLRFGDLWGVKIVRLARRGAGGWEGKVHERWVIDGQMCELENPILHYPHSTMVKFLQHINAYSTLRAQELYASNTRTNLLEIIFWPLVKFKFLYVIKLGFLDGVPGFVHAMTMAFYTFLVKGKLWLLYKGIPNK